LKNEVKFLDQYGEEYGIKHIGNKPRVSAMPYTYDIAEGNVPDHDGFRALGENPGAGATEEDLWEKGAGYVFPSAGMGMEVISTGANNGDDASAGTGIQTVEIHYLDDTWAEQYETVTMNGGTAVPTDATNILRINGFHAATVGSGGVCAGATGIDLRHLSDTPVYSHIAYNGNEALQSIWTVPISKTGYLTDWHIGAASTTASRWARFLLRATVNNGEFTAGVFHFQDIALVLEGSDKFHFTVPLRLPAKTDIKISVLGSGAGIVCVGAFAGWYES
jgi:hypothetical protein